MSELYYSALGSVPVKVVSGTLNAYRTVTLAALHKYSPDPRNTAGSRITGGRYNPPEEFAGAFEMLYLAESTAVAHAEARAITVLGVPGGGVQIGPGSSDLPRLDLCVHLELSSLLDLTDPGVLALLGVSHRDLLGEWFPRFCQVN